MREIDELHLEYPFAGSGLLRNMLRQDGHGVGSKRASTLMKRKRSISRTSVLSIASHESSRIATTPYNDRQCPGISGQ